MSCAHTNSVTRYSRFGGADTARHHEERPVDAGVIRMFNHTRLPGCEHQSYWQYFFPIRPDQPIYRLEATANRIDQLIAHDRFPQDTRKVRFVEARRFLSRHDNDRDRLRHPMRGHLVEHIAAMNTRQAQIENDRIGYVRIEVG